MTLEQRVAALATAIGTDVKGLITALGSLAALTTTDKSSLVNAINELQSEIGSATSINDAAASGSSTYSSNKIVSSLAALKTEILGGASAAYDTLLEIQAELQGDDTSIANLLTAVGNRVDFDAAQTLTTQQKLQACNNIGIGNPDADFAATYTTAKS